MRLAGYSSAFKGHIEAIELTSKAIQYDNGSYGFEGLFVIASSAKGTAGISGAIVMTSDGTVLGMVFAGWTLTAGCKGNASKWAILSSSSEPIFIDRPR